MVDLLTSTLFPAPSYRTYGTLILEGQFEPAGFAAPLGHKDIRLLLAAAESLRVPMPIGSLLNDRFVRLLARGDERLDWSAIGHLAAEDASFAPYCDTRIARALANVVSPVTASASTEATKQ